MNHLAILLIAGLVTATLALTVAMIVTWLLLRLSHTVSPAVHRLAWCAVLLVGWSFARLPVKVPWYAPLEQLTDSSIVKPVTTPVHKEVDSIASADLELAVEPVAAIPESTVPLDEPPLDELQSWQPPVELPQSAAIAAAIETASTTVPVHTRMPLQSQMFDGTANEQTARVDLPVSLVAVWLIGMLAIGLAWLSGYLWFVWRLPRGLMADADWLEEWRALLALRGVRCEIPLRVTTNLGPLLCRLPRGYCLAVPETLWRDLDATGRASILKHELAHYQRGDVWSSLAVRVLALPQWFNPCSWYAVRRFDEAAEWACDRAVADEHSVAEYARTLLRLGTDPHGYASYRPAASGKPLAARVRRLLRLRNERDSKLKVSLVLAAAIGMALFALVRVELVAQEPPASTAEDSKTPPDKSAAPGADAADNAVDQAADLLIQVAPANQTKQLTAAQATTDAAKKAYEGNWSAYENNFGSLDALYIWSLRWLQAAERSPPPLDKEQPAGITDREHRLNVTKQHLERMKNAQERVKALHEAAVPGGERERLLEANFYVAEAEQRIADLEASNRLSGNVPGPQGPSAVYPDGINGAHLEANRAAATAREVKIAKIAQTAVAAAKTAYKSTLASYQTGSMTLDSVIHWSSEWMNAEQGLPNRTGKDWEKMYLASAQAHLERMQALQKQVKALFETGSVGGRADEMASINFHVAQAERLVAEVEDLRPASTQAEPEAEPSERTTKSVSADGTQPLSKTLPIVIKVKGPQTKQIGETAEFTITAENTGKVRAEELQVNVQYDRTLDPVTLTDGYKFVGENLAWNIPKLEPGKSIALEINCKCIGLDEGARLRVTIAPKNGRSSSASAMVKIQTEDSSANAPDWQNLRYQGKSASEWSEILKTELSEDRQIEAIEALGAFAPKGHGGEIATLLFEVHPKPDSKLENYILQALYKIPRETAVPLFATAAKSDEAETRRLALITLATTAPTSEETKAVFKAALHDADWSVVNPAVNLLAPSNSPYLYMKDRKAFPPIPELAPDLFEVLARFEAHPNEAPDGWEEIMRNVTVHALARCGAGAKVAFPVVLPWLNGGDISKRYLALIILEATGAEGSEAVPALVEFLKDHAQLWVHGTIPSVAFVQTPTGRVLQMLRVLGPAAKGAAPVVLELATESVRSGNSPDVSFSAFKTLEAIGLTKAAVPELIREIGNESKYRAGLIKILAKLGPEASDATEVLQSVIVSDKVVSKEEVIAAIETLGAIGPAAKAAIPTLLQFTPSDSVDKGDSPPATLAAFRAIQAIGAGDETPAFVGFLAAAIEKDATNRVELIKMLAAFGPKAKDWMPVLEKFAKDQDSSNKDAAQAAAAALEIIQQQPKSPIELLRPATSEKK